MKRQQKPIHRQMTDSQTLYLYRHTACGLLMTIERTSHKLKEVTCINCLKTKEAKKLYIDRLQGMK